MFLPYTPFPPLSAQDPLGTKQQSHPPWKLEVTFKCFHFPCFHHVLTGDGKACSNGPMFERGSPPSWVDAWENSPALQSDVTCSTGHRQTGRAHTLTGSQPYPSCLSTGNQRQAKEKDCVSRAATLPMEMEGIQQFHPEREKQQIKSHKGPEHAVYRIIWHQNLKAAS